MKNFHFQVGSKNDVILELVAGKAEVFGSELILNKKYTFGPGTEIFIKCRFIYYLFVEEVYLCDNVKFSMSKLVQHFLLFGAVY